MEIDVKGNAEEGNLDAEGVAINKKRDQEEGLGEELAGDGDQSGARKINMVLRDCTSSFTIHALLGLL